MIERPISSEILEHRDTVRLFFERSVSQEFYIRAAVAWPEGSEPGFAVLGAQDIKDKIIWVFEGYEFYTVPPVFQKDRKAYNGFEEFLRNIWKLYSCRTVFYRQPEDVHHRFALKCWSLPTIEPKPEFLKVPSTDEVSAENLFKEMAARGSFRASKQGELYQAMGNQEKRLAKHALICLLAGYEDLPWIDTEERMKFHEYFV